MVLNVSILSIMSMVRMMASGWWVDSTAVSIFVLILVALTNTEMAVVSPPRALLNFRKATNQRGMLSGAFFL